MLVNDCGGRIVGQDYLKEKMLPMLMYKRAHTCTHTHTCALVLIYKAARMQGRLNTMRNELRYLIRLHFYIGKDLTRVNTHRHTCARASQAGTDSETDAENPRAAGFTGMIISAGLHFLLRCRIFILHFFPEISPFQGYYVLEGLISIPQWT